MGLEQWDGFKQIENCSVALRWRWLRRGSFPVVSRSRGSGCLHSGFCWGGRLASSFAAFFLSGPAIFGGAGDRLLVPELFECGFRVIKISRQFVFFTVPRPNFTVPRPNFTVPAGALSWQVSGMSAAEFTNFVRCWGVRCGISLHIFRVSAGEFHRNANDSA